MYLGITMMAIFEGSFISSWIYLITFPLFLYAFSGSLVGLFVFIRNEIRHVTVRNCNWLLAEAMLGAFFLFVPAYFSPNIHEYEGPTINHVIILIGVVVTTVNWRKGFRKPIEVHPPSQP